MKKKKTDTQIRPTTYDIHRLVKIGLSKQEAKIYLWLLRSGPLRAISIARILKILPNAVYRTIRKLEEKGLVSTVSTHPRSFQAMPPRLALAAYSKNKALLLTKNAEEISESLSPQYKINDPTQIETIFGKEASYLLTAKEVKHTKKELLIISIGEAIPPYLLLALRRAYERGVDIKLIVHKYDDENRHILNNFEKNGMKVRHYPDWGFHLAVYDKTRLLLSVNNPENTDKRINIFMKSGGLAKAMRDYFYSIWEKSIPI